MKFDNKQPIYLQIIDYVKEQIMIGRYKAGEKMPSVRELADSLRVNPNTVQRAYRALEEETLIETLRGQGSVVTNDKRMLLQFKINEIEADIDTMIQRLYQYGYNKETITMLIKERLEEVEC